MSSPFIYPTVRRDESFVEDLHGVRVADPYRWLEDPTSPEVKAFVASQNALTTSYIDTYPHKSTLHSSLTQLVDYDKYGVPSKIGPSYYYYHNRNAPQAVLYKIDALDAEPTVVLNVNEIAEREGKAGSVSVCMTGHTLDGKLMAYGLSRNGSDWAEVKIKDTETMEDLEDVVSWCKFTGISWTHDNLGFFYTKYPEPATIASTDPTTTPEPSAQGTETDSNANPQVYYHRLGTAQSSDALVFSDPANPLHMLYSSVTDCGAFIIVYESSPKKRSNLVKVTRLGPSTLADLASIIWIDVVTTYDSNYQYVTNEGSKLYFHVSHPEKSPRGKIMVVDVENLGPGFVDVVPETEDVLSEFLVVDGDKLVLLYLKDLRHLMYVHELRTGKRIGEVEVPLGTIGSLTGDKKESELFFSVKTFLSPGTIYRYDFAIPNPTLTPTIFRGPSLPDGFDPTNFTTKQVRYSTKDGTEIPMFLLHRTGLTLDSSNPTLVYGYGGFGYSMLPQFNSCWVEWLRHIKDGVLAVANIRGGGEFGEKWHKAGIQERKQNVFDDFQFAVKWLHREEYTQPNRTAIMGASNGGLLVAACVNQAPELFGCAITSVGVLDMLRFHKFTIGSQWRRDYGDPDAKEDFDYIYKYSPYHNLEPGRPYPSILIMTSDHDDRVVPLHSFKYAAQLQHVLQNTLGHMNPGLICIETGTGHGGGKALNKAVEENAIMLSFIALSLKCELVG